MPADNLYEYAVIRYVPQVEREEFINVGLAMMCKRARWIRVETRFNHTKAAAFSSALTPEEVERQLEAFCAVGRGDRAAGPMAQSPVEERFRWLTAERSACIQTSRPHPGLSTDLDATFARLLTELV